MAKQENKIYEFDTAVFPRRLWVVKDMDADTLHSTFRYADDRELELTATDSFKAQTYPEVVRLDNDQFGILVYLKSEDATVGVCAHEAVHFALSLLGAIEEPINTNQQEVLAYLIGWATERIYGVAQGK
jgi:hypothetical protein